MDLGELIKKGEVAWLSAEEMMKASEAAGTPHNGAQLLLQPASSKNIDENLNNSLPRLRYWGAHTMSC